MDCIKGIVGAVTPLLPAPAPSPCHGHGHGHLIDVEANVLGLVTADIDVL